MSTRHFDRRAFLRTLALGTGMLSAARLFSSCSTNSLSHIKGSIVGANSGVGHLLRQPGLLPVPTESRSVRFLIAGSGIAGLSARKTLEMQGIKDLLTLEMSQHAGGNSAYGTSEVSAYPWGAHYLPIPEVKNGELIEFLDDIGLIKGFDEKGLPYYDEYSLCHDPEERLLINGYWQEGLVPDFGVPFADKNQFSRFFAQMEEYRNARGSDGKDAFTIPLALSSQDEEFRALDKISFAAWLKEQGYVSPYLLWYLDYGCRDDYGTLLAGTSAWAGIHYFASRKGKAANAGASSVLTWPEGNGFLVEKLKSHGKSELIRNQLVYKLDKNGEKIKAYVYDTVQKTSYTVDAERILLATPQFVNKHLLTNLAQNDRLKCLDKFEYAPWLTANLTVNEIPGNRGMPISWDNVFYGRHSLGYVNACHQNLSSQAKKVLTYYEPLHGGSPAEARRVAYERSYADWLNIIVEEMEYAHRGITERIEKVDVWIWGHGMIAPSPSFIWGKERQLASEPIENKVFFAHSDLSGISIFEEAFYQGSRAAKEMIASI